MNKKDVKSAPPVRIDDLKFGYSHSSFRLNIPALELHQNHTAAIIGPSGSGKTTLLNLIAGILLPDEGQIVVADFHVTTAADHARRAFRLRHIGLVFQEFELIPWLSVLDNVLLPGRISDAMAMSAGLRDRAMHLLDRVGLRHLASRSVTRLSQGERQRVAICRALLPGPTLILADEPTGNLDPTTSRQVLDLLMQTASEESATLIAVTHDHSILNRFDRTIDFEQFLSESQAEQESLGIGASS